MRQFITGPDGAFRDLEERARYACICFDAQEMPPGARPTTGRVGFEVNPQTETARLLVQRGLSYDGPSDDVRQWLASGEREFASFGVLRDWVRSELGRCYGSDVEAGGPRTAAQLTDIDAVRGGLQNADSPLYLDEEALFGQLRQRVLGQDNALRLVAGVMARHCARRHPARPAVMFAVGPSGVGKTKTAEATAESVRSLSGQDTGYQFLRLDMTEYQESHRVSQLIGAPQGYVGHGQGSQLLDSLRANPRTIVLFDEIEKAHPAILRVLMNAMDAGRLSTSDRSDNGHEVDCRCAVFMFTSNLDAKGVLDELNTRSAHGDRAAEDEICRRRLHAAGIPPEIVGRIGRFLVFRPLTPETRAEIMALSVAEVADEYGVDVAHVAPAVIVELMQKIRSQSFGVRPERFLIDDALGSAFAEAARQGEQYRVRVLGPPFRCEADEGGASGIVGPASGSTTGGVAVVGNGDSDVDDEDDGEPVENTGDNPDN